MRIAIIVVTSFITALLQLTLAPKLLLFGHATPDLIIPLVLACALYFGNISGMISGLICGFILDIYAAPFFGLYSVIYTITGFVCGYFNKNEDRLIEYFSVSALASAAISVIRHLIDTFISYILKVDIDFPALLFSKALPSSVYTVVLTVFVMLVFALIRQRMTGKKSKRSRYL